MRDQLMRRPGFLYFHRIGLSEFYRFVAVEDLESPVARVEDLRRYVQPNIAHRISHGLEGSSAGGLC